MIRFGKRRTEDTEDTVRSLIEEVKIGARTYLTHPGLCFSELRGRKSVYAAANIMHLTELYPESVHRCMDHEFEWMQTGECQATAKKVIIRQGRWGEQGYLLALRNAKYLIEQLDVMDTFEEASAEDIVIDWEDEAWAKAKTELYQYASIDVRSRLGLMQERKRNQLMWDAYVAAKKSCRYIPPVLWNRVLIDIHAIKGQFLANLSREVLKEGNRKNVSRLPRSHSPSAPRRC